jgi:hypothetical protein
MMCVRKKSSIKEYCGTSLMHPAATRSIRTGSLERPGDKAAADILGQYAELIEHRRAKVAEDCKSEKKPDMRTGWLLWQLDLDEFLYFEEPMIPPDPSLYYAEWSERPARGARKATKNLWIYEKKTDKKRFSVTTEAGAKIQPYFDVPPPSDPNLHFFRVQGEEVAAGQIRIWITKTTALCLKAAIGSIEGEAIAAEALKLPPKVKGTEIGAAQPAFSIAQQVVLSSEAYRKLRRCFSGVSDEQVMQQFAQYLFDQA